MFMNIIFLVCFLPVPLIIFFVLRNETKPKKNLILGVTLPQDKRGEPAVTQTVKRFLAMENAVLILLLLLLVPQFFIGSDSAVFTWYMCWLLFAVVLPMLPYASANRRLRELKRKGGWFGASTGVTLVDTKIAVAPKRLLSIWVFIPAFLLTLAPVIHTLAVLRGRDEFWPMLCVYLTMSLMTASFYGLYRLFNRQRAEVMNGDTSLSAALTQVRRYNWNKTWIWIVWLTGLFDVALWLLSRTAITVAALAVVYAAALLAAVLRAEFKTRNMQQRLTEESGGALYTDDDDNWLLGFLYYNRNDSHGMVNRRIGVGMTLNLAKTPGKLVMIFTALILLSTPLIGISMIRSEATPVSLRADGSQIVAVHTGVAYAIDIDTVTSAYFLDKLPRGIRTNGTAMKTVLKGSFRYDGIGDCRLCLDPRYPPYLVVLSDGRTYILGSSNPDDIRAVYETLVSRGLTAPAA